MHYTLAIQGAKWRHDQLPILRGMTGMQRAALLGASLGMVFTAAQATAKAVEWEFETLISVPYSNTLFLARDAQDNVYVTSFNSSSRSAR